MENNEIKRTELKDIGEFGLISKLVSGFKNFHNSTVKGVGDDAAVLDPEGKMMVLSTDMLIEGIHFDLTYTPLKHLGYKAAIVNFSDIAAMNCVPTQITVSIALSSRFSVEAVEEIYVGIKTACEVYKVDLVGGDTTSSKSGLIISISVVGFTVKDAVVLRNSANENDLICVSGDLGAAYTGLLLLEREKTVFKSNPDMQPDLDGYDYVLQRQLKPEARLDIVELLKQNAIIPTSMIDISDGLASEILHVCTQSNKGAVIYEDKIPVDPQTSAVAEEFNINQITCALNGGEDYELLFTIKLDDFSKLQNIKTVSVIGHITSPDQGVNLITKQNEQIPLTASGWNSFGS